MKSFRSPNENNFKRRLNAFLNEFRDETDHKLNLLTLKINEQALAKTF